MRLTPGGIRELHRHDAGEWSLMLSGNARITAIDTDGESYLKDVTVDDLWYFPTGTPHSIQGLGPDGCEFLLVFDDGKFSAGNTTLISDRARHTPREVLAKNSGVPEGALDSVYSVPPARVQASPSFQRGHVPICNRYAFKLRQTRNPGIMS